MNDMIRGLGLRGPGWRIGIDLEEYLQRSNAAQLRRLLKLLDTAENHNALEPVSCGDPAAGTPRILAAAMELEAEIPELLHSTELHTEKLTEDIKAERRAAGESLHWERLTDNLYLARLKLRRLQSAQKRLARHKELIEQWIRTQK